MDEKVIEREQVFHDEWADSVDPKEVKIDALEKACTLPETRYIIKFIEKVAGGFKNKKILEIGCGCGEGSVYFATRGAMATATDLSPGMVKLAQNVAKYHSVEIEGVACSADKLPFEDKSFDIVYAANILHHVDIESALDEAKRVLKPGGYFISWDPIKYNPVINIYRKLASGVRTEDEHPIDLSYIKNMKKRFVKVKYRGFWLATCLIFVKYFFVDKVNPSKERYWKKIVDDAESLEPMYAKLENIDNFILRVFPFLKWMCWNMVAICKKEK